MLLDLTDQLLFDSTLQPLPVKINTGSALALEILGIPRKLAGAAVTGVDVAVTNPDGALATAAATAADLLYFVTFAASLFTSYGTVLRGVKISIHTERATVTVLADLVVKAATPDAQPGQPGAHYQVLGSDTYLKSEVVSGVQHYKRLAIAYNERLHAWAFQDPEGDYVLDANGAFIPYTPEE